MSEAVKTTLPSGWTVTKLIGGLALRRARRGKLLRVLIGALTLPVLAGLASIFGGKDPTIFFDTLLNAYLRYLIPMVMALQASATVAEEVQIKTIGYIFARPIPRWSVPLGKYLGNLALNTVLLCGSIVAAYLACMGPEIGSELPRLGIALATVALASLHFGAVSTAFGAMVTTYPFAAMLGWILVFDIGFGLIPGVFKATSMGVHLTVIAGLYKPHSDSFFMADPKLTTAISLPVIIGVTLLWLILALGWVKSHEYRLDK